MKEERKENNSNNIAKSTGNDVNKNPLEPSKATVTEAANGNINKAEKPDLTAEMAKVTQNKNGKALSVQEPKKDFFGTAIDKAKKQHHITFRDIISGEKIADVKEVESYKEFNVLTEEIDAKCACSLL